MEAELGKISVDALQKGGVFEALEQKGCTDGDTVSIYEFEFDYVK